MIDSGSADRIQRLENLQNKAIRRIEYCMDTEMRESKNRLSDKYKIESLKLRRKRNLVKIIYTQSMREKNLKTFSSEKNLRSMDKVKLKNDFTSKTKVFNSPLYRGIRLWDKLPADLQKEKDKNIFKRRVSLYSF